ncbi:hypothetical protein [Litorihabitans aurantiacus]|uniref:Uncharacterized protein n=1 Tax=Litorihabitans aurantiacus TaxID=1930061 RepID=A0AA37XE87_9MICO|nr:hypothetical protein [Litorihabitans aurantiacus]GMA31597.1 hypothetical protein GCM10025875_15890 [Litorihabitans aurantiacus]
MSIKITSPIEGFTGKSVFGPTTVTFDKGVAELEDLSTPLRAYLETKGYTIEGVEVGPFDPAKHKADDVIDYLAGLDRSDEAGRAEFDRVAAAERASEKPRAGVLKAIEKAEADAAAAEAKEQEEAAAKAAAAQASLDAQGGDGA